MKHWVAVVVLIILFAPKIRAQQIDTIRLKICNIKELKDCYILTAYDDSKSDSIYLISLKSKILFKCKYEKVKIGNSYYFQCSHIASPLAPNGVALRIKNTTVWKPGDDPHKIPIFSPNAKGLYLKKININKRGSGSVPTPLAKP